MSKQQVRVGIKTNQGSLSENCCTSQFLYRIYSWGAKRDPTPRWANVEKFIKRCWIKWRTPDRAEEIIVVFNHNIINLYFTANKSTMYVHELLW